MRLEPGTLPWLIAHDLRLSRRRFSDLFRSLSVAQRIGIVAVAGLAFHLLAWPLCSWLGTLEGDPAHTGDLHAALAAGLLFVLPWMLAQSLTSATRALYVRGDLDLMLASPVSARAVLAARAVAIAFETLGAVTLLVAPVANVSAIMGRVHWLAIYPMLLASGLMMAAIGLGFALGLFHVVGPQRTRLASQILATVIGAGFVLGIQLMSVLPDEVRQGIVRAMELATGNGGVLDRTGWAWLPARAAMGDGVALLAWGSIALLAFTLVAALLGPRFAQAIVDAGGAAGAAHSGRGDRRHTFRTRLATALRIKEWRLLLRDPWLGSQLLLQIIYTLPVAVVLWRSQGANASVALAVAPSLVVIASQISAALAWLAVSGEDAPEFLATAPVERGIVERRKLEAITLPVALILGLPIAGLAWSSPAAGALTAVFALCAAASTAMLNLWHPMPGRRRDMMRRHTQSKLVAATEHVLALLWAMATVLALFASPAAILPMLLAAGIVVGSRKLALAGVAAPRAVQSSGATPAAAVPSR